MFDFSALPSQWPRTLGVLGIGILFLLALVCTSGTATPLLFSADTISIRLGFSDSQTGTLLAFSFFLVSYIVGEVLISIGTHFLKKTSFPLARYAMVLFVAEDKTGFWIAKLWEAERRAEMFFGLFASAFLFACVVLLGGVLDGAWPHRIGSSVFAVFIGCVFFGFGKNSYSEISTAMDSIITFKQPTKAAEEPHVVL